ncbi:glycosyltransferase family 8 protein [Cucurbitaria berberidis CBS 394.84]|uniref:Glycosyltransferase family 8 protein n=1 Tax=Cucurbitaria berberidis CBS 394.84 TaxID=1168544 RepID=A0A9P4GUG6_9PLEO|nr:glycosyltransferase family 8 protein [Cucurbitaria berberidis CBS 394.84]KAF1851261.1 glycosyltransferase family 8 protein [Cucurbitaria berberidis CBS 394.84]
MANTEGARVGKDAYVTLLTRPSYLAGAILLAYTLNKHSPDTPLIITYTPETLPEPSVRALEAEAQHSNILLHAVEHLRLPDDGTEHGMVAERFTDTWTKLRVFDLHTLPQKFERICWLDADMMVFSNPSPLIFNAENDAYLQGYTGMRLMAVHTCVCNLDHDTWAPQNWNPRNCALTHLTSSEQLPDVQSEPATFGNFNSGTFLYRPSPALSSFVQSKFEELGNAKLRAMKFPDQDFLNAAFDGRWRSLSWKTNALKTWRYWHINIWRDEEVAVLHYIVDKPWVARLKSDGTAGYLGKDGETHKWWWDEYAHWHDGRMAQGGKELLEIVGKYVASETGEESEEMRAIGGGAQEYANKWAGKNESPEENEGETFGEGPAGPILRKPMIGERGHGPVVRGRGRGRGEGWSTMES